MYIHQYNPLDNRYGFSHGTDRSNELPDQTHHTDPHSKLLPEDIKGQLKKTLNKRCFLLYQYLSYKPHSSFKPKILFVSFKRYFDIKKKSVLVLVLQPGGKDRKYPRDKVNIGNPKLNRGCASLTANRTLADCMEITLGPSIQHIPLGVYRTEGFNAMILIGSILGNATLVFLQ